MQLWGRRRLWTESPSPHVLCQDPEQVWGERIPLPARSWEEWGSLTPLPRGNCGAFFP